MKEPTKEQVAKEVLNLKNQLPYLPRSAFGEDNQEACRTHIYVLAHNMTERDIYDRYEGDPTSEEGQDHEEEDKNLLDAALDAGKWLRGEEPDAPSKGWQPIVDRALGKFKKQ